jgi:3-hydroxyisobutyrate dehydrogenase
MTTIAFIGLGNMGGPMAANLVKAGHTVVGYDLAPGLRETAQEQGVGFAFSAREAVKEADVVITMLPAGRHVLSVWTDVLPVLAPGTLVIDSSTIDVESARKAHDLARQRGCPSLDAPVSGGVAGAKAATLTFMAGGSKEAFARAEPILANMGKRVVHCGEAGAGQAAKICNNLILGASMIAVSEAFVLGEKLGLSHQALFDVASAASGQCWALTTNCPVPGPVPTSPANRGYQPGFAGALMAKDLNLAVNALQSTGVAARLGPLAAEIYDTFAAEGGAGRDFSAIITDIRDKSDLVDKLQNQAGSAPHEAAKIAEHTAAQDDGSPE